MSLGIIRPYYGKEVEGRIKAEKDNREKEFLAANKNLISDENELKKKAKEARKLDPAFWSALKKENPEIFTMRELSALFSQLQRQYALLYNETISKIYVEALKTRKLSRVQSLLSSIGYKKAYEAFKDSSLASGLRQKLQSNFNKSKFYNLINARISLPTATSTNFPVSIYRQTSSDKYAGFEIQPNKEDFVIKLTLPEFKIKENVNPKTKKKFLSFEFLKSQKKKEIFLLLSTKRRRQNDKQWFADEGTSAEIRKVINGDLKKEWAEYAKRFGKDKNEKDQLRNKYKIGWLEIRKGKKIGEKFRWFLNLVIELPPKMQRLDKNIVGGIDIGVSNPIVCALNNSLKRYTIGNNDVLSFNRHMQARRRILLRKNLFKRKGHGSNNKLEPITSLTEKSERFRSKIIERWAKEVQRFFLQNSCGIVQMEDLSNLKNKEDNFFNLFLRGKWPYAEMQNNIERKLSEIGIEVKKISPKYTSQLCSNPKCLNWNKWFTFAYRKENRFPLFKCEKCNLEVPADYNAAKNIANPKIEKITERLR